MASQVVALDSGRANGQARVALRVAIAIRVTARFTARVREILDDAGDALFDSRIRQAAEIAGVRFDGRPREVVMRELAALGHGR